jgi:hypothetical protein
MENIRFFNGSEITFQQEIPTSWEELSGEQFKKINQLIYAAGNSKQAIEAAKMRALQILLNPKEEEKRLNNFLSLEAHKMFDLLKVVNFLFDTFPTRTFIPSFRVGLTRYYLPAERLSNAVMIEYTYADNYLSRIPEGLDDLDKLVATLCRPSKWFWFLLKLFPASQTGDRRQKFNYYLMTKRAKKFKKVPLEIKLTVLYFFVGCKLDIIQTYKNLFPERKPGDESKGDGASWVEIIRDVASQGLYGDYDKTAFYNLHTVLTNLDLEQQRINEQKLKSKK